MSFSYGEESLYKNDDMKILVTNDDGIYSPGLSCLARVALAYGEVIVMAPDVEQSSMGQAITS